MDNQIFLAGLSPAQLVEIFRPMIQEEVKRLKDTEVERLLSPAETCKLFEPNITKVTLASWTAQGLLTDHRIGGRVFYKQSEIMEKLSTLRKYRKAS